MKIIINKLLNSLSVKFSSLEKCFSLIEIWMHLLGCNVFDSRWFWKGSTYDKIAYFVNLILIFLSGAFGINCAFNTFKDSLEGQLTSLLAALFSSEVSY